MYKYRHVYVRTRTHTHARTHTHTQCCSTNVFLREVTGASDALVVDMDLQLLDHVGQPIGHGPQQGVHVGHVWTKQHNKTHCLITMPRLNVYTVRVHICI